MTYVTYDCNPTNSFHALIAIFPVHTHPHLWSLHSRCIYCVNLQRCGGKLRTGIIWKTYNLISDVNKLSLKTLVILLFIFWSSCTWHNDVTSCTVVCSGSYCFAIRLTENLCDGLTERWRSRQEWSSFC